jgi:hypothetical protein
VIEQLTQIKNKRKTKGCAKSIKKNGAIKLIINKAFLFSSNPSKNQNLFLEEKWHSMSKDQ